MKPIFCFLCALFYSMILFGQNTSKLSLKQPEISTIDYECNRLSLNFKDYTIVELRLPMLDNQNISQFSLKIPFIANDFSVYCEPNRLRSRDYKSTITAESGVQPNMSPDIELYKGYLGNDPNEYFRFSIYKQKLTGYFHLNGELFYIEPIANFLNTNRDHYLFYKTTDVISNEKNRCIADQTTHEFERMKVEGSKQDKNNTTVSNCYELEIATDADLEYFQTFGNDATAANAQILSILNQVEGLFCSSFNMSFIVNYQNVHTTATYTGPTLLDRFEEFRAMWNNMTPYTLVSRDVAHLYSGTNFGDGPIGWGNIGTICSSYTSAYSLTQHYNNGTYGQVVVNAHEFGHNFNGRHSDGENCTGNGSVMCHFVQLNSFYFSAAEINTMNSFMNANDDCIKKEISISPSSASANACGSGLISKTFTVPFFSSATYQWQLNNVDIVGATSNSYIATTLGTYTAIINNYDSNCSICVAEVSAILRSGSFVVTNTNDAGVGSLRDAIINANDCSGKDTITFDIPGVGPHTIFPLSQFPLIIDTVFVDGYSQSGAVPATANSPATLKIEIDGSIAGNASGFYIRRTNCKLTGLAINSFSGIYTGEGCAIFADTGSDNLIIQGNYIGTDISGTISKGNNSGVITRFCDYGYIGGPNPEHRNLLSGNATVGVGLRGSSSYSNYHYVQNNLIGTDITGTMAIPNGNGIAAIKVSNLFIENNIISGNNWSGIHYNFRVDSSFVFGNYIGTDITGSEPLGNGQVGIELTGAFATIGSPDPNHRNIIANNGTNGIVIHYGSAADMYTATNNTIQNNHIGTGVLGTEDFGNNNDGIVVNMINSVSVSYAHKIGGINPGEANIIANNHGDGIDFNTWYGSTPGLLNIADTEIFRNRIYNNAQWGIRSSSMIPGPVYNPPNLNSITIDCPSKLTTIDGILSSALPNKAHRIEFFYTFNPDANGGEGGYYIGYVNVTTDAIGEAIFTASYASNLIPAGSYVSATATGRPTGTTSEFSVNRQVAPASGPSLNMTNQTICEGNSVSLSVAVNSDDIIRWSSQNEGLLSANSTSITYTPTSHDSVYVFLTTECGQVSFDTVAVFVNSIEANLGVDTTICSGTSLELSPNLGANSYLWSDGTSNPILNVSISNLYGVTITDASGCLDTDEILITTQSPSVDLGTDFTACEAALLNAGDWESYAWNSGETTQFLPITSTGSYEVSVTDDLGCVATNDIFVTIAEQPFVDLGDTLDICGFANLLDALNPGNTYLWSTGETTQSITASTPNTYQVIITSPQGCQYQDEVVVVGGCAVLVNTKLMLEGPYDPSTGLMKDHLRANGLLPLTEPYTDLGVQHYLNGGGETVNPSVLETMGSNAIVDWIFLELRDATNYTNIIATRSALLQADGDVVDLDGTSYVTFFGVQNSNYYVVARHRNHLPVMTPGSLPLNGVTAYSHDFTTGSAFGTLTFTDVQKSINPGVFGLWQGDLNLDGGIDASDRSLAWNFKNQAGYLIQDSNMDGVCDAAERSSVWNNKNLLTRIPE